MSAFNDFAVDPCVALQIKNCIALKECLLAKFAFGTKLKKQLGGSSPLISANLEVRLALNDAYACILEGLQKAYALAGETFPPIPPLPTAVDFSAAAAALTPLEADLSGDSLKFLEGVIEVEFDGDGIPTMIKCPQP